jgi:hypothetical protein
VAGVVRSDGAVTCEIDAHVAAAACDAPLVVVAGRFADGETLAADALFVGQAVRTARRLTEVVDAINARAEIETFAAFVAEFADAAVPAGAIALEPAEPAAAVRLVT